MLAVLVVALAAVLGVMKYKQPAAVNNEENGGTSAQSSELPVSLTNPSVTAAFFSYNFYGEIKELKTANGNIELTLSDSALPVFILTEQTKVQTTNKSQVTGLLDKEDLKVRLGVTVVAYYDAKNKTWVTSEVYVPTDVQSLQ